MSLASDPLERCRQVLISRCGRGISPEDWDEIAADTDYCLESSAATLRDAVRAWGNRWHLRDAWIRAAALATLEAWAHDLPQDEWHLRGHSGATLGTEPFVFNAWEPTMTRWKDWEGKIFAKIAEYREGIEKQAADTGMVRTKGKLEEHFLWLARFQVRGDTMEAIARDVRIARKSVKFDRTAVRDAIRKTASLIGLGGLRPTEPHERVAQS